MEQPGAIFLDSLGKKLIDKVEANKFLVLQTDNDFNWRNTKNISSPFKPLLHTLPIEQPHYS
jgi:hypothetical protein